MDYRRWAAAEIRIHWLCAARCGADRLRCGSPATADPSVDGFAFREAKELQTAASGPAPAVFEDRGGDGGLFEELFCGVFGEELEDVAEGEAVLLGKGDVDAVVGGGGLQFEVESAAEAFAEGQTEGFVDATPEGGMKDELHAAAVVEETLGDDGGFGGEDRKSVV